MLSSDSICVGVDGFQAVLLVKREVVGSGALTRPRVRGLEPCTIYQQKPKHSATSDSEISTSPSSEYRIANSRRSGFKPG